MKIPVQRLDLEEIKYPGLWVEVPNSVTEGWIYDFQKQQAVEKAEAKAKGEEVDTAESNRGSLLVLLDLVKGWNFEDDDGKALPLVATLKDPKARIAVISQIPIDILLHLSKTVTAGQQTPELTRDLSNGS